VRRRFPWSWLLPAVVVIVATVVVGALRYPDLPARIPAHFSLGGNADRWVRTSVVSAFFLVWTQILVTAVLAACAALTVRAPGESGARAVDWSARSLLIMAACLDLGFFLLAWRTWSGADTLGAGTAVGAAAAFLAGVAAVGVAVVATARDRRGASAPDGDHWHGFVYVNRDDPAVMVPKRHGIGWTLNFGRPVAWVFLVALIGVPVLLAVVGTVTA
jgi:uncharacterized membrane protein